MDETQFLTAVAEKTGLDFLNLSIDDIQSGAHTLAQDEALSIVFGMPKAAIELGGAEKIVPLSEVARTLLNLAMN